MTDDKRKRQTVSFYEQKKRGEIYPETDLDTESEAKLKMYREFKENGIDINSFADIELKSVKSVKAMRIMVKYYPFMTSPYTKEIMLRKIDVRRFPCVIESAYKEYINYSPNEKTGLTGLQTVIGKSEDTDFLYGLLSNPDDYAAGFFIREALSKKSPDKLDLLVRRFENGLLLPEVLFDYYRLNEKSSLERAYNMSENDIKELSKSNRYTLCKTFEEKYKKLMNYDFIHQRSKELSKKIKPPKP